MSSPESLLEAIQRYTAKVRVGDAKAFQWIYFFDEMNEAQQAVQLLNASGLSARAYPGGADSPGAKVNFQFNESTPLAEKLPRLGAFFALLRELTEAGTKHISPLADCRQTLHVSTPDGKNILYSLKVEPPQPVAAPKAPMAEKSSVSAAFSSATPSPAAAKKNTGPSPVLKKKSIVPDENEKKISKLGDALGGRLATHTSLMLKFSIGIFAVAVIFLMARGFLCPDFAHARTTPMPWYCSAK